MNDQNIKTEKNWTFWLVILDFTSGQSKYTIEEIGTINTINNFYQYFMALPKISEVKRNSGKYASIGFFKNQIKPAWECEENKNGGSFQFVVKSDYVDEAWRDLLLSAVGGILDEKFSDSEEMCGIVISPKKEANIYGIDIWTKDRNKSENDPLKDFIVKLPGFQDRVKKDEITFKNHIVS